MPKNLRGLAKPRANQYDNFDKRKLNPLGQRLLEAMKAAGIRSPRDFAVAAFGERSKGGNLSTQLGRLTADKPDGSLMGDQLAAYARAARVSLFWLLTGEGSKTDGPYGQVTGEEMKGIPAVPEALTRAMRALADLDERTPQIVLWAAAEVLNKNRGKPLTASDWLDRMRILIKDTGHDSGLRESVRIEAAPPTNDA